MRLLTITLVLAFAGAGCGGEGEAGTDGDTVASESITEDRNTDEATDATGKDADDADDADVADSLSSRECRELVEAAEAADGILEGAAGDVFAAVTAYELLTDRVPDEILEEFDTVLDSYVARTEVLARLRLEPDEIPDAATLQRIQDAAVASLDQAELAAAQQRIIDWAAANC